MVFWIQLIEIVVTPSSEIVCSFLLPYCDVSYDTKCKPFLKFESRIVIYKRWPTYRGNTFSFTFNVYIKYDR